ncbi:uncharacterized protein LOC142890852 [Nelusetta ayraudi]|uniref:uncharacterized protein LOC142890852 n=1 Tax=Nelusetta ayraudi TaxID=303726 RepID=UPI003F71F42E
MAWESKGSGLPPASLQLLVPPVRLMSAFIWRLVQHNRVLQYDKVLDFITLTTSIVPELLSPCQRAHLTMDLRARLVLEMCRHDGVANLQKIQEHLDKIHTCCAEVGSVEQMVSGNKVKTSYTNFASLVQSLLNVPLEKEAFFQDIFPTVYGSSYDKRLKQLVSQFLFKLEQLLPVPNLEQTAAWLTETASMSEEFERSLSEPLALRTLLLHHAQLGNLSTTSNSHPEDLLLPTLGLPSSNGVSKGTESHNDDDDDDYTDEEDTVAGEDSEEDKRKYSNAASVDWLPKMESGGASSLFTCPQCPYTHRLIRRVQEHIQKKHRTTSFEKTIQRKALKSRAAKKHKQGGDLEEKGNQNLKNCRAKIQQSAQKRRDSENKAQRRRKEPAAEDKRFLSTRPVSKNFTEDETKCGKCGKVFEHPNQLKTHIRLHSFAYSCGQCEKGFTSLSGYYQHQRLHKKGRNFTCAKCKKAFLCGYSLRQHERLHEGPFTLCAVCGKGFSKTGITRHMQMHRGERNYLCTTCGKSFLSSGELLLHTRSHTGETPYTCVRCGKGFSCKSHLNVHTRSHTGERPYLCAECPKRFLTLNCLKRHRLSHNGAKPFKCPDCGKDFSQRGNMKRHMTTHKPESST